MQCNSLRNNWFAITAGYYVPDICACVFVKFEDNNQHKYALFSILFTGPIIIKVLCKATKQLLIETAHTFVVTSKLGKQHKSE